MPDGTDTGTTQTTTTTESQGTPWTASLPETIRGHEAWKEIADVPTLASKFLETRKPFAEQLPKDIAADASFKDIKSLDALARSYQGQVKLLGVPKDQLLRLPTSEDPKDWAPIYDKLGRPEKPEGYKLTVPEGETINGDFAKRIFAKAHSLGVPQKQLDGLYGEIRAIAAEQMTQAKAHQDAELAKAADALKAEWGAATDQKIAASQQAMEHMAKQAGVPFEALKAELEKTGLGNSVALTKIFEKYAQSLREDGLLKGKAAGSEALNSPTEARQSIAALQQDKVFMAAYLDKRNAGHAAALEKMRALYEQANPSQAA